MGNFGSSLFVGEKISSVCHVMGHGVVVQHM